MSDFITAAEALALPRAQLTHTEKEDARQALRDLEEFIRDNMTFAGLPVARFMVGNTGRHGLDNVLRTRITSDNVIRAIRLAAERGGWVVVVQLMLAQGRVQGAPNLPHHWTIQLTPETKHYEVAETGSLISTH